MPGDEGGRAGGIGVQGHLAMAGDPPHGNPPPANKSPLQADKSPQLISEGPQTPLSPHNWCWRPGRPAGPPRLKLEHLVHLVVGRRLAEDEDDVAEQVVVGGGEALHQAGEGGWLEEEVGGYKRERGEGDSDLEPLSWGH